MKKYLFLLSLVTSCHAASRQINVKSNSSILKDMKNSGEKVGDHNVVRPGTSLFAFLGENFWSEDVTLFDDKGRLILEFEDNKSEDYAKTISRNKYRVYCKDMFNNLNRDVKLKNTFIEKLEALLQELNLYAKYDLICALKHGDIIDFASKKWQKIWDNNDTIFGPDGNLKDKHKEWYCKTFRPIPPKYRDHFLDFVETYFKGECVANLHNALITDQRERINLLVDKLGVGILNAQDKCGYSLLDTAVKHNLIDLAIWLREKGADTSPESSMNLLPNLSKNFRDAIIEDNLEKLNKIDLLLNKLGLDINSISVYENFLNTAIINRAESVFVWLIDKGASINRPDKKGTPLDLALQTDFELGWQRLIDRQALTSCTSNPLSLAIQKSNQSLFKYIVDKHPNMISQRDIWGAQNTPLHKSSSKTLETLLEYYPNIEVRNREGLTPLDKAMKKCHIDNVKKSILLLNVGAKLNSKIDYLEKVVTSPCMPSKETFILTELLIEKGCNVKETHIHTAKLKGRTELSSLLSKYRANIN